MTARRHTQKRPFCTFFDKNIKNEPHFKKCDRCMDGTHLRSKTQARSEFAFSTVRQSHRSEASTLQNSSDKQVYISSGVTATQIGGVKLPKLKRQASWHLQRRDSYTDWRHQSSKTQAPAAFSCSADRRTSPCASEPRQTGSS